MMSRYNNPWKIFEDIELGSDNIYELERSLFYE